MGLSNALQNRPVRVLGFIAAVHAVIYGVGLLLGTGGFGDTVLYTALGSNTVVKTFATALLLTGLALCFAYTRNNPKTIFWGSWLCGMTWLYATFTYALNGAWLLAIGIGLPWAVLASYLAYAHKNRQNIINYDQSAAAKQDTRDEDKL